MSHGRGKESLWKERLFKASGNAALGMHANHPSYWGLLVDATLKEIVQRFVSADVLELLVSG
jgi:hypothetical protein